VRCVGGSWGGKEEVGCVRETEKNIHEGLELCWFRQPSFLRRDALFLLFPPTRLLTETKAPMPDFLNGIVHWISLSKREKKKKDDRRIEI
jgi:hypothetical protein